MYAKEFEDLLNEYLTDGIITSKERQVLLKKAQELGYDVDEVDLYIDAQQQKCDQAVEAAAAKKRGKTCPFCGAPVPQLVDKCPHCGGAITVEATDDLQEIIDKLENALVNFKSGKDIDRSKAEVERYVRKAKIYYENNPKIKKLVNEVEVESAAAVNAAAKRNRNKVIANVLTFNKKLTTVAASVILLLVFWVGYVVVHNINEYKNKAEIDAQYEELVGKIRSLDDPNASNFQDVANKLLKIHWKDIDDSEYNKSVRENYFKEKKSAAKKISEIWLNEHNKEWEKTHDDSCVPISDEIQLVDVYLQY